jgi:TonB family protein
LLIVDCWTLLRLPPAFNQHSAILDRRAVMFATLILLVPLTFAPQSQPPRDRTAPQSASNPSAREAELTKRVAQTPNGVAAFLELSRLQEARGASAEAEATLLHARQNVPTDKSVLTSLAGFYNRQGSFEKTIEALEAAERIDPTDPTAPETVATYYWDKAYRDQKLLPADQLRYVMSGIAATDRALALKPDYVDALTYKNLLLRMQANLETDPVRKQQLIAEADVLRTRAMQLSKQRAAISSDTAPVPLPPPPPDGPRGLGSRPPVEGIQQPTKIKDVRPIYPPDALAARITGVVIIEVALDAAGHVRDATVLRSIPALDEAALAAVRQWEFTPAISNGVAVPVKMTVTVNFTLQ